MLSENDDDTNIDNLIDDIIDDEEEDINESDDDMYDCDDEINKQDMINYNKGINNLNLNEMLLYYVAQIRTLDYGLSVSTITITVNSLISFNVSNIGKYFNEFDEIITDKYYDKKKINLTSVTNVKIKNKNKNLIKKIVPKGNFLNQVSFIFDTSNLNNSIEDLLTTNNKKKKINIKLFKNGSIHCTGLSKHLPIFKKAIEILFKKLMKPKAIYVDGKFIDILFVDQVSLLKISNIKNFIVQMINLNFVCNYNINRNALYTELKKNNIDVDYDPNENVISVNIKYKLKNKKSISIMVFESGSVSITGANSCSEINEAYYFINSFLFDVNKKILLKPINVGIIIDLLKTIE